MPCAHYEKSVDGQETITLSPATLRFKPSFEVVGGQSITPITSIASLLTPSLSSSGRRSGKVDEIVNHPRNAGRELLEEVLVHGRQSVHRSLASAVL